MVSKHLERAFEEASKLPEEEQQELAAWILEELESERRWDRAFSDSADQLARLADEALEEHRRGVARDLHPNEL